MGSSLRKRSRRPGHVFQHPKQNPASILPACRVARSPARLSRRLDCHRLRIEPLEDRRMLTAFLVDSFDDTYLDDGLTTLREAIYAADYNTALWEEIPAGSSAEPDTIEFDPALFIDGANLAPGVISIATDMGAFTFSDPAGIVLQGPGPELLTIDAHQESQIVMVYSDALVDIAGVALTNGSTFSGGGGIYNGGVLSITDAIISGNSTTDPSYGYGGAIYSYGDLTIADSTISDNFTVGSEYGVGGGIASTGTLSITRSTITRNSTHSADYVGYGGGVYAAGVLSISDSTVSDNFTAGNYYAYGGGVYCEGSLSINDSTISGNMTTSSSSDDYYGYGAYGGGVYIIGDLAMVDSIVSDNSASGSGNAYGGGVLASGAVSVAGSIIAGNTVTGHYAHGGGIHNDGLLSLTRSAVSGNRATSTSTYAFGGGVSNQQELSVVESTIADNSVSSTANVSADCGGAGIYSEQGTATIIDSVISGNVTPEKRHYVGGGVYVSGGTLAINGSTISENYAYLAGGLYNDSTMTIDDSTVIANSANDAGGICNWADLTVADSTISGNWAVSGVAGGIATAVHNSRASTLRMVNSTLSGNSADDGSAMIMSDSRSSATLTNCTITANSASDAAGGAVSIYSGTLLLNNTVVAGNADADGVEISGNVSSASSHNVVGVSTKLSGITNGINGNQVGDANAPIDPMLGPLADNGGATLTHEPLPGSPLINAGSDDLAVDGQGATLWTDQRGLSRRFGLVDVGAVEQQPPGIPLAYPDGFVVDQDASAVIDVLANDFCTGGYSLEFELVDNPSHGTLLPNPDGTLTYTPEPGFWGVDRFSYRAVNGQWVSNETDVIISVVAPTSILVTTADDEIDGDLTPEDISLREALQIAEPGSIIQFSAELMDQVIGLRHPDGALNVSDVRIVGLGPEHLTIDGRDWCRVIEVGGESLISQVTISGALNSGIYAMAGATLTVENCVISGNTSFGGSGIFNDGATVTIVDSLITNNAVNEYAFAGGGGILNRGAMTISGSVISHNSSRSATTGNHLGNRGGGILNEGTLVVVDSIFTNNDAGFAGGGICSFLGAVVTVSHCEFLNNQAGSYAGGLDICSDEGAAVSDSLFTGNVTTNTGGGAIATSKGLTTITRSIIAGNSAVGDSAKGGGVYCTSGQLTIVESTISGNAATQYGGGIYARESSAVITLRNSTVAGNTASMGGGVANINEAVVTNSIIALNTAPTATDFNGTLHADSCFNLIGIDPLFVRNPGPGDGGNLRLRADSPAVNAGNNALAVAADGSPLLTDLDGRERIIYDTVDIGAYELLLTADANYDGSVGAADAAILSAHWGRSGMTWTEGDFNDDGIVNILDAAILAANWEVTVNPTQEEQASGLGESTVAQDTSFVGPLPDGESIARRPLTAPAGPRGAALVHPAEVLRKTLSSETAAAACDVVVADEYGPQQQGEPALKHHLLAWSSALARRNGGSEESERHGSRGLAVDLLMAVDER